MLFYLFICFLSWGFSVKQANEQNSAIHHAPREQVIHREDRVERQRQSTPQSSILAFWSGVYRICGRFFMCMPLLVPVPHSLSVRAQVFLGTLTIVSFYWYQPATSPGTQVCHCDKDYKVPLLLPLSPVSFIKCFHLTSDWGLEIFLPQPPNYWANRCALPHSVCIDSK